MMWNTRHRLSGSNWRRGAHGAEPVLLDPKRKPAKLPELDSRANEIWRVLLRIADLAGEDWPERARRAAVELSARSAHVQAASTKIRLLASIRDAFSDERMSCKDLADALNVLEEEAGGLERWEQDHHPRGGQAARPLPHHRHGQMERSGALGSGLQARAVC
jgi:Protein of unknown function (DUF3631)